jgi:branched-chain amino acid transport system permease protein
VTRTVAEARRAGGEARAAWTRRASAQAMLLAAILLLPLFVDDSTTDRVASYAYLALAAVGLGLLVGPGRLPVLCQGAFFGVGALCSAHLHEAPVVATAALGAAAAAAAGAVVGLGTARLRPVYVAAATWLVAWAFALALRGFPSLAGGARGIAVAPRAVFGLDPTPTLHFEIACCLVAAAVLGRRALATSPFGLRLAATGARPSAAAAAGVGTGSVRLQAFVGAAAAAGAAGALAVDLALVADPTSYGPRLSFELLAACIIGGAVSPIGPVVGVAVLGALNLSGSALADATVGQGARFGTMLSALLLLVVLATGSSGVVPALDRRRGSAAAPAPHDRDRAAPRRGAVLEARGLVKRYGKHTALDGLDLRLEPGSVVALIGPNGSGKTTALRIISGAVAPDLGQVLLDDRPVVASPPERVGLGIVRTLQRTTSFDGLSVLQSAEVGAAAGRRDTGMARALLSTPRAREAARAARGGACAALEATGLAHLADEPSDRLTGAQSRMLAVAVALATRPRVLLLDEPAAGVGDGELGGLAAVIDDARRSGLAILLVEHNLRLVKDVADTVVVLDAGAVVTLGTPDEVARDAATLASFLGRRGPL